MKQLIKHYLTSDVVENQITLANVTNHGQNNILNSDSSLQSLDNVLTIQDVKEITE